MGDPNGTLPLNLLKDQIVTDIEAEMSRTATSAYVRFPFTIDETAEILQTTLFFPRLLRRK